MMTGTAILKGVSTLAIAGFLFAGACQRDMGLERTRREAERRAATAASSTNPGAGIPMTGTPSNASPAVGATFTVEVAIGAVQDLYGAAFSMHYDPQVVEFVSFQALASFLKQASGYHDLQNAQPGILVMAISKEGQVPGDAGQGGVAQVLFRAKAPGDAALSISHEALIDSQGQRMAVQVAPIPQVTVR